MSPFMTRKSSLCPSSFSAFFTGPAVPKGVFTGSQEYFTCKPCFGIRACFMLRAVCWFTASMISVMPSWASFSKIHCSKGLLRIGKRVLGLVQLKGLRRVANPPARITAFI